MYKENTACVYECSGRPNILTYIIGTTYLLHYRDQKSGNIIMIFYFLFLWVSFKFSTCDVLNPSRLSFNECLSNPCKNSAVCIHLLDSYPCICLAGFNGSHCETGTRVNCAIVMCLILCLCLEREAV